MFSLIDTSEIVKTSSDVFNNKIKSKIIPYLKELYFKVFSIFLRRFIFLDNYVYGGNNILKEDEGLMDIKKSTKRY